MRLRLPTDMNQLDLPARLGRLPSLIGEPAGGSLTADQWLVFVLVVAPLAVSSFVSRLKNVQLIAHPDPKDMGGLWRSKRRQCCQNPYGQNCSGGSSEARGTA